MYKGEVLVQRIDAIEIEEIESLEVALEVEVDRQLIRMLSFWRITISTKMCTNLKNPGLLNSTLLGVVIGKEIFYSQILAKNLSLNGTKLPRN